MQWQIIEGETTSGVTVFIPDDGVDTGAIVVQKGDVTIEPKDTTGSLFFRKLCPLGVDALVEATENIDKATARLVVQDESQASFQGLVDDAVARIDLQRSGVEIDRLARGCDPQPGAFLQLNGTRVRLYDVHLASSSDTGKPPGTVTAIDGDGIELAVRGGQLRVGRVRADAAKEAAQDFAARVGLSVGDALASG